MKVAIAGAKGGSFELRGRMVAERLKWDVIELTTKPPKIDRKYDLIVLVKYDHSHASLLRSACKYLWWDALDAFSTWAPHTTAEEFWTWAQIRIGCDAIIATSPACAESMSGIGVPVFMLPHHSDPRVEPIAHDLAGDVVYWGARQYIDSGLPIIAQACDRIGRTFRIDETSGPWTCDRSVSVALHLRLPPFDSDVMRRCKPQVKLANAAAARIPVLATDDPCATSLCPEVTTVTREQCQDVDALALALSRAIDGRSPSAAVTLGDHCRELSRLIRCW